MRSYAYVGSVARGGTVARELATKNRLERLQVCLRKDIMDRCWDIASIDRVTVASLVEEALSREIDRREAKRGEPYPPRRNGHPIEPPTRRSTVSP